MVQIYYKIDITNELAFFSGLFVILGLLYLGDQAFNDGDLCTHEATHYFDANSGQEISCNQAQENKSKNKQADLLDKEGNELHGQESMKKLIINLIKPIKSVLVVIEKKQSLKVMGILLKTIGLMSLINKVINCGNKITMQKQQKIP